MTTNWWRLPAAGPSAAQPQKRWEPTRSLSMPGTPQASCSRAARRLPCIDLLCRNHFASASSVSSSEGAIFSDVYSFWESQDQGVRHWFGDQSLPPLFNLGQFPFRSGPTIQTGIFYRNRDQIMMLISERVAAVLKRELKPTIERWMKRVDGIKELTRIPLSYEERTGHLPQLLADLITRLGMKENQKSPETTSAHDHGKVRFDQGYTVPMLVEESRLLQVSIFDTLRINQKSLDA